ncbi:hypothetical protein C4K88_06590 [Arthrobacter pityocampae]|uniref:Uncharacterized protein n=1 Tax=Arthrobacter pityocampae TaxID=547334 RepID=A0A2S5IXW1_9MICC|nr:hypothetical protein C4K88_06590 [Arthrobacter pityocampae]
MDLGEQSADPVRRRGDLRCEVVVEAAEHAEFGQRLIIQGDRARVCGMDRTASAMVMASRASVLAWPGCRFAIRRPCIRILLRALAEGAVPGPTESVDKPLAL